MTEVESIITDELVKLIADRIAVRLAAHQGAMLSGEGVRLYLGGMSETTFHRLRSVVGPRAFPEPVGLEGIAPRWRRKDIDAWIAKHR